MKIIYYCYGAAHSSVISAAIHLGIIQESRVPTVKEILQIPYFDKTNTQEIGIPFYYGSDNMANEIYIQGMGGYNKLLKGLLKDIMLEYEIPEERVIMINTLKNVNILTRIGGYLSRGLGLIFPGRILAAVGLKISYKKFIRTVSTVKNNIC